MEVVVRELDAASNLDAVFAVIANWTSRIGFSNFGYWLLTPPEGPRKPFVITNYPAEWIERHRRLGYASHDYAARHAVRSVVPFLWEHLLRQFALSATQKVVFDEAATFGLSTGATIPIHGPAAAKATFSVASDMPRDEFAQLFAIRRNELHLVAIYAHEKILGFNLHTPPAQVTALTPREFQALTWTAQGKTRWDVGMILGISEETVKAHLEGVRRKLGASNTTHAIAIAMLNGLLKV